MILIEKDVRNLQLLGSVDVHGQQHKPHSVRRDPSQSRHLTKCGCPKDRLPNVPARARQISNRVTLIDWLRCLPAPSKAG
jgi:hypothetical protein